MGGCYTGYIYYFADVDIGQTKDGGTYNDTCSNIINIKEQSGQPASGYKKYTHTFASSYLGSINHHSTQQSGFEHVKGDYYTEVTVCYLDYDGGNVLPLLIRLRNYNGSYEYYKKEYYGGHTEWQRATEINEGKVPVELGNIVENLNDLVVINLKEDTGKYYANGDPEKHPAANPTTTITVSEPITIEGIYEKYGHRLESDEFRLLCTRNTAGYILFEDSTIHNSRWSSAFIYYWSLDYIYSNPLLLELTTEYSSTYYTIVEEEVGKDPAKVKVKKWKLDAGLQGNDRVKETFDKENCKYNGAHTLNISKNVPGPYDCPTKCGANITVSYVAQSGKDYSYSKSVHSITDSSSISVSRFKEGTNDQTGLPTLSNVPNIIIFFYPKDGGNPLLIYCDDSEDYWYKRVTPDSNHWSAVPGGADKPGSVSDHPKIQKLLLSVYAPEITIQIEKNEEGGVYLSSESGNEEIVKYKRRDQPNGYYQVIHTVVGKSAFNVKSVTLKSQDISIIKPDHKVESIAVYFSKDTEKHNTPLLVEILKKKKDQNYEYYTNNTTEAGVIKWIKDGSQTKMDVLTPRLGEIKAKVPPEPKAKPMISDTSSTWDTVKNFAGGSGTTLVTGLVGYGGWKVWKLLSART